MIFKNVNQVQHFYTNDILKSLNEAAISLRHLGKSIFERNLYIGPLEIIIASVMTLRLPAITCPAGGYKKIRILTISGVYWNRYSYQLQFY